MFQDAELLSFNFPASESELTSLTSLTPQTNTYGNKEEILKVHKYLKNKMFTRSSDAHLPDIIGTAPCYLEMETRSFEEIKMALHGENGRGVRLEV